MVRRETPSIAAASSSETLRPIRGSLGESLCWARIAGIGFSMRRFVGAQAVPGDRDGRGADANLLKQDELWKMTGSREPWSDTFWPVKKLAGCSWWRRCH